MATEPRPATWKILLAFSIIYFVWGSTFLAIRVGVREVPPLILAAIRFSIAGLALYAWISARGEAQPTAREWRSASLLGLIIFVFDYGLLFWAEQRVPSGVAAVMLATIPVFMALSEIIFLRTQRLTLRLVVALLIGIFGVAVLMAHSLNLGGPPADKLAPPPLFWPPFLYLMFPRPIIGFTAYVWLLHHESPTKVGTYAYVNPIVAVLVGYFLGGEELTTRTILGSLCIFVSVVVITTIPAKKPATAAQLKRSVETAGS